MSELNKFKPLLLCSVLSQNNNTQSALHGSTMASLTLQNLPPEIILNINDFLPPRSTTCLALTCKKLYNSGRLRNAWIRGFNPRENRCGCRHETLKSSTCPPLPLVNHERYLFLQMLSRDLPEKQLCDYCQCFHQQHQIRIPRVWHKATHLHRTCGWTSVRGNPFNFLELRYQLHFADVQQIMNRYRGNEPSISLLDQISIDTDWAPLAMVFKGLNNESEAEIYIRLMVEAKILSGYLMIHSRQTMCVVSSTVKDPDMGWTYSNLCSSFVLKVCPHIECSNKILRDTDIAVRALSKRASVSGVRTFGPEGTNRCSSCLTELALSIDHQEEEGYRMTVESWTNLGTCEWNHQPAWQAATSDTVIPDRFILHRNRTPAFETTKLLGYPSDYGCELKNKSDLWSIQSWPLPATTRHLYYHMHSPFRPFIVPIYRARPPAPLHTAPQWSTPKSVPNCTTQPSPLPSYSPLPRSASTSRVPTLRAPSPPTTTSPATVSSATVSPKAAPTAIAFPTSPDSDHPSSACTGTASPKSATHTPTSAPTSSSSSPSPASLSLELVDDQANHSAVDLSLEPPPPPTNKLERTSARKKMKDKLHKICRKIKVNVS